MPDVNAPLLATSTRRWFLPLAALAIVATYGNSFSNSFHYDDFHSIVENPHIRVLGNIPAFFSDPSLFSSMPERAMYRPLVLVTYAFNYWAHGYELFGYHLVNVILHMGCTIAVYLLGIAVVGNARAAAFGALVFGLHPLQAEATNYISSRSESLAAFWYLLSLLLYLRWRARQRSNAGSVIYLAALAAFALALLSKATAVVLPLALLAWEFLRERREQDPIPWAHNAGYWIVGLVYVALIQQGIDSALGHPVRDLTHQIYTQIKAMPYYLQLVAVPVHLSVEHGFRVSEVLWKAPVLFPALLLLSAFFALWRQRRAALVCAWTILPLLPSSIVPLNVLVNEHRLYLPLSGIAIGVAMLVAAWSGMRRLRLVVAVTVVVSLAALTAKRNRVWESEMTLWNAAVRQAPEMYRSQMHLGGALEASGRVEEAVQRYQRAAELAPSVVESHYNLANGLRLLGQIDAAVRSYEKSLELDPTSHNSLINLSAVYLDRKQLKISEDLLRRAAEHHPASGEVHRRLGILFVRQGRFDEARSAYQRAIFLRPDNGETYYNLANLQWTNGEHEAAEVQYRQALSRYPDHLGAHMNLGSLYLETGRYRPARDIYAAALTLAPSEPSLFLGLAQALEGLGAPGRALESYRRFLRVSVGNHAREQYVRTRIQVLQSALEGKEE